jgi:hypothetical protein
MPGRTNLSEWVSLYRGGGDGKSLPQSGAKSRIWNKITLMKGFTNPVAIRNTGSATLNRKPLYLSLRVSFRNSLIYVITLQSMISGSFVTIYGIGHQEKQELDTKRSRNWTPCGIHPDPFGYYFSSHPTTILRRLLKAPRHTICFRWAILLPMALSSPGYGEWDCVPVHSMLLVQNMGYSLNEVQ